MVWVARLIHKEGYKRKEYKALLQAFGEGKKEYDVPHAGEAAWRRANGQSKRDAKTGGDNAAPLPPIPWNADVELYMYLGGIPSDPNEMRGLAEQKD